MKLSALEFIVNPERSRKKGSIILLLCHTMDMFLSKRCTFNVFPYCFLCVLSSTQPMCFGQFIFILVSIGLRVGCSYNPVYGTKTNGLISIEMSGEFSR